MEDVPVEDVPMESTSGIATMDAWITAVCRELQLGDAVAGNIKVGAILEVAKDAAHGVERPAAPVSTYLMGLAVAAGADPAEVAGRIGSLAKDWVDQVPLGS